MKKGQFTYTSEWLKLQTFNRLTYLSEAPPKIYRNRKEPERCCLWKCQCGKEVIKTLYSVMKGLSKSCGCLKSQRIREKNSNWRGYGELPGDHWTRIKNAAKERKLKFEISIDYVWDLFLKQNRLCALTKQPLMFDIRNKNGTASLDRINSSLGYVKGNVQWIHKDINIMKQAFTQDYYIKICRQVAEANPAA